MYPTKSECLVWVGQTWCSAVKTQGELNVTSPTRFSFPPYLTLKTLPHPRSHGAPKSPSELFKNLELQP